MNKQKGFVGLLLFSLVVFGCQRKNTEQGELVIYPAEEIKVLFDNALRIDTVGKPVIQITRSIDDSTKDTIQTTSRSQYYRIYVARDGDNHLIPKSKVEPDQVQALIAGGGGIGVLTSCQFSCKFGKPGDTCPDMKGCNPSDCGCVDSPSCGTSCTLATKCTGTFSGFGFGSRVIM